jgi:predicted AlkP superfamily phosphohydrolase/phosphomutase
MKFQMRLKITILSALLAGGIGSAVAADKRLIVLGIDGMDPNLLSSFMAEGLTPNLAKLANSGGFMPLGTSIPPQSPVAWSNFITGMNPGGHGLFDFLALDREQMMPYLSSSRTIEPDSEPLKLGTWQLPLEAGQTLLMRKGTSFWETLDANGIPATMFRVPANYPPVETATGRSVSGMGTPDIKGSSGTFSFFSNDPDVEYDNVSGGVITKVRIRNNRAETVLEGPVNVLRSDYRTAMAPLTINLNSATQSASIAINGEQLELSHGEWSDWVQVEFELVPWLVSAPGMVRFYLQDTEPYLKLYASPVNIDPRAPAMQISSPAEYAAELAENAGPFYTQEMPEDTKALMAHIFTPEEFIDQSDIVLEERRKLLDYELDRFNGLTGDAFLFFYISSVDQRNHMLTRQMDTTHPLHDANTSDDLKLAVRQSYLEADEIVGRVLNKLDDNTDLIVMSDHGFAPFNRQVNLNTWLEQNGYLKLVDPAKRDEYEWLDGIDWAQTQAFSFGLNSLYLNVKGRERNGIVNPANRAKLAREISDKLAVWADEENGELVVTQPLLREEAYSGPHVEDAPDIIVGYARGYRVSWASAAGEIPLGLLEDNDKEWSGDHCMDSRTVPGVILSTKSILAEQADLRDLSATILDYFGIARPAAIEGSSVYQIDNSN